MRRSLRGALGEARDQAAGALQHGAFVVRQVAVVARQGGAAHASHRRSLALTSLCRSHRAATLPTSVISALAAASPLLPLRTSCINSAAAALALGPVPRRPGFASAATRSRNGGSRSSPGRQRSGNWNEQGSRRRPHSRHGPCPGGADRDAAPGLDGRRRDQGRDAGARRHHPRPIARRQGRRQPLFHDAELEQAQHHDQPEVAGRQEDPRGA